MIHYGNEGQEIHGKSAGTVMVVEFEIFGQAFMALNGGPQFKFDEAISFQIPCETQDEVDYFWEKLVADGDRPDPADGSRISSASRGRWSQQFCPRC